MAVLACDSSAGKVGTGASLELNGWQIQLNLCDQGVALYLGHGDGELGSDIGWGREAGRWPGSWSQEHGCNLAAGVALGAMGSH